MTEDEREVFVGIDVGKDRLDVHIRPHGQHVAVGNDQAGLAQLLARLEALAPRLIVLEASGGYEQPAAVALLERGLAVAVVNPRQTRKFAQALGQLAKTDRIDAAVLAHFAEAVRPAARVVVDPLGEDVRGAEPPADAPPAGWRGTAEQRRCCG